MIFQSGLRFLRDWPWVFQSFWSIFYRKITLYHFQVNIWILVHFSTPLPGVILELLTKLLSYGMTSTVANLAFLVPQTLLVIVNFLKPFRRQKNKHIKVIYKINKAVKKFHILNIVCLPLQSRPGVWIYISWLSNITYICWWVNHCTVALASSEACFKWFMPFQHGREEDSFKYFFKGPFQHKNKYVSI